MTESYLYGAELIEQIQKSPYSRDLIGYHGQPPEVKWPNNAKVAVQFVLNYEEGGEKHIEHGDEVRNSFYQRLLVLQAIQPSICRWTLCTNMVHVLVFGAFIVSSNGASSQ